jgi:hypothetical protein
VRLVFVGGVVDEEGSGAAAKKNLFEIGDDCGVTGLLDVGGRVGELKLDAIAAEAGGLPLLESANFLHLLVGVVGEGAGAGRAGAVGDDHAAESEGGVVEAIADGGVRHDFNVVLMGGEAQVGDLGEGSVGGAAVGDIHISLLGGESHGRGGG